MLFSKKYFNQVALPSSLVLMLIIFSTCKKYPEGGFEKRGPVVLLKHNGAWTLTLYEVNGIDSTNLINYNGNEKYKEVSFYKEDTPYHPHLYGKNFDSFIYIVNFLDDNTKLSFADGVGSYDNITKYCWVNNSYASGCYRLFFNPEGHSSVWGINKLTKKELILECRQNHSYKLKFKPR